MAAASVALSLSPSTRSVPGVEGEEIGALVERARNGENSAWCEIVKRFGGLVFSIARGFRLSNADAADVSQTVWLRFAEHLDRISDPERAGAWLATTTRRECLRVVRISSRVTPSDDFEDEVSPVQAAPEERLVLAERRSAVAQAFLRIPEHCQRLLRMMATDVKIAYGDIADQLAMPIGSIGPTRGRCLEHLRKELVGSFGNELEGL
jgi:RNA polymerase sigma factor (sigma-70 family)